MDINLACRPQYNLSWKCYYVNSMSLAIAPIMATSTFVHCSLNCLIIEIIQILKTIGKISACIQNYPLTAPAVTPEMIFSCRKMYNKIVGIIVKTIAANILA